MRQGSRAGDTQSIRLDRLVCLEDLLDVFESVQDCAVSLSRREADEKEEVQVENLPKWEDYEGKHLHEACNLHRGANAALCPCTTAADAASFFIESVQRILLEPRFDEEAPQPSVSIPSPLHPQPMQLINLEVPSSPPTAVNPFERPDPLNLLQVQER